MWGEEAREGMESDVAFKNIELLIGKSVCLGLPHDRILQADWSILHLTTFVYSKRRDD